MQHRVENTPNIEILYNTETDEILGDIIVNGARVKNINTGETRVIDITGFFVAIGHTPNTQVFKGFIDMDEQDISKPFLVHPKPILKVYLPAAMPRDKVYRQAIFAAGTGCMAALDVQRFLSARKHAVATA